MAKDATAEELVESLRAAFCETIRAALVALPAHEALQLADAVCTTWLDRLQGLRVTHRERPKIDAKALAEDWARGLSVTEIAHKHKCSRATAYRLHPNGPQKKVSQKPE